MSREVVQLDSVFYLDFLKMAIHHLYADDGAVSVQKARLRSILDVQSIVAIFGVRLKALIYANNAPFTRLVLIDGKLLASEYLSPRKGKQIAYTEPEEESASQKETCAVIAILEKFADEAHCGIPIQIFGCGV